MATTKKKAKSAARKPSKTVNKKVAKAKAAPKKAAAKKTPAKKKPVARAKPAANKKPATKKKVVVKKKPAAKKTAAKKTAAKKPAAPKKVVARKSATKAKPVQKAAAAKAKPAKKTKAMIKAGPTTANSTSNLPFQVKDLPKSVDELLGRPTAKSLARKSAHQKPLTAAEIKKFHASPLNLRDRIIDEISFLSKDNLNKSSKEASGDLSSYSLHMADQGTDNFDREFAASLLNTEHDVLYEIDEAVRRIEQGTYGICEISGQPVERERLKVLPFARYCVAVQSDIEKKNPRQKPFRKAGLQSSDYSAGS